MDESGSIFDLSFRGRLPEVLRAIADRIEREEASVEEFVSRVTPERFEFSGKLDLREGK